MSLCSVVGPPGWNAFCCMQYKPSRREAGKGGDCCNGPNFCAVNQDKVGGKPKTREGEGGEGKEKQVADQDFGVALVPFV